MKVRNCEKCGGTYATGKDYGDYWCILSTEGVETKGLCEFCNPKSIWYIKKRKDINSNAGRPINTRVHQ